MKSLLSWLVGFLPAAFRTEFGADIVDQVCTDYDRARERGRWSAVVFAVLTAIDLARTGFAERWNPTWVGTRAAWTNGKGGEGMMTEWMRDLYYAYRSLRRAPGFTAMTVGTLGVAIGANSGIFAVVDAVLLDPLPFEDADRLVYIAASAPGSDYPEEFGVAFEFFLEYREATDVLEDVATFNSFTATLRVADRVERVRMSAPTYTLFSTLGVAPALGRLPVQEDEDRVAVLSHALWIDWFGADPGVIGRSYSMARESRTVIGVMGPEFAFPTDLDMLWIPRLVRSEGVAPGRFGQNLVARLVPGVELEAVRSRLTAVAQRLPEKYGGSANYERLIEQHRAVVRPLREQLMGDVAGPIWVLFAAVGMVLLIACSNVANLFLVRGERRQRDVAVRRAIGAGRGQLVRAQLAEAVLVAAVAGALALMIAWVGVPALVRAAPRGIPGLGNVALSGATVGFTVLACFFSALACGLVPALRSASSSLTGLQDGSWGSTRRRHWGRDGLVVAQTALALVLLVGSGLLIRSYQELRRVDPGYDTADIFTFQLGVEGEEGLTDGPSFARFHMDFMGRVAALPGVESVGIIENVPLNESVGVTRFVTPETASDPDGGVLLGRTWAGGDYFETMGISVLRGRGLEEADHTTNPGNVVISQAAADMLWPGADPMGRQLQWLQSTTWETVVGVVEDVMQSSFRDQVQPLVYFPLVAQDPATWALSSPAYVVKTVRADDIAPEVRALARELAPTAPMYRVFTMDGLAADSMVQLSFIMLTLGVLSALALLLGTVGLYGVLSYVVAERTREIGLRMALGARAERVRGMVVRQGARVVVLGVLIGIVVAAGTTRALGSLLFGIEALDPITFFAVAITVVFVGILASYVPARRASNVDPVESLRGG